MNSFTSLISGSTSDSHDDKKDPRREKYPKTFRYVETNVVDTCIGESPTL